MKLRLINRERSLVIHLLALTLNHPLRPTVHQQGQSTQQRSNAGQVPNSVGLPSAQEQLEEECDVSGEGEEDEDEVER